MSTATSTKKKLVACSRISRYIDDILHFYVQPISSSSITDGLTIVPFANIGDSAQRSTRARGTRVCHTR